ncbi:MAG: Cysteinyl-tRNA synthetase (EC [uncultured Caballeronia sp.]|nr:MAG: Cysteinyl-tRNA synthetase (EC [uncultured Caballeronia sp.]
MSKFLGNVLLVRDLFAHVPGEVIRLALLATHYRKPAARLERPAPGPGPADTSSLVRHPGEDRRALSSDRSSGGLE